MTAHFDRNISFVTSSTQNPLKIFISSLKNSDDHFLVIAHKSAFFTFFNFSLIHHCNNSLSSLHIFVHHCTFCASLHVKTCPIIMTCLYFGFAEIDSSGQFFAYECVWVVSPFEDSFKGHQLLTVERRSISTGLDLRRRRR